MGLSFALVWSSAFSAAHMIVAAAPPLWALVLRFLLAGIIGVSIAAALGQTPRLTRGQWRATAVFGLCQNALYLGLNYIAMQRVDASLAAIIASTMPLIVALAGWAFLGERLRPLGVAGLVAGFVGVTVIMATRLQGGAPAWGVALCGVAVVALSLATLTVRGTSSGGNVLMIVGLQMLVGAVVLGVVAGLTEPFRVTVTPALAAAFVYVTLVPGLLATWIWFMLVNRIGPTRAATFHFLNPFFGVLIAAVLLHEQVGPSDILGVAIIAAGIFAVQWSRTRRVAPAAH